jgi:hypothetical protein
MNAPVCRQRAGPSSALARIALALLVAVSVLVMHGIALTDVHGRLDSPPTSMLHGETTIEGDTVQNDYPGGPHALEICVATTILAFAAIVLREHRRSATTRCSAPRQTSATVHMSSPSLAILGIQRR